MKKNWKSYLFWIAICEAVGVLSGLLSMKGMRVYTQTIIQPSFAPPSFLFPVVWSILFALMGIGVARVRRYGRIPGVNKAQNIFWTQIIVNFFWPLLFFNLQAFGFSFLWLLLLWVLVLTMLILFYREDMPAGLIQLPYLLWLTFAAVLNYSVWMLN